MRKLPFLYYDLNIKNIFFIIRSHLRNLMMPNLLFFLYKRAYINLNEYNYLLKRGFYYLLLPDGAKCESLIYLIHYRDNFYIA